MTVIPARTDTDHADQPTPADTGAEPGPDTGDRLDQSWLPPTDDDDQPLAY